MGIVPNRRIDTQGPSRASGGMMALNRDPSTIRASTIGFCSSTRRPTAATIRSMICIRCLSSLNVTLVFTKRPFRSTKHRLGPVDHDVRDFGVAKQWLQRSETKNVVEDLLNQTLPLHAVERQLPSLHALSERLAEPLRQLLARGVANLLEVERLDELVVQLTLDLGELNRSRRPLRR